MTDDMRPRETREGEGRRPSDVPGAEVPGSPPPRPDFLPAEETIPAREGLGGPREQGAESRWDGGFRWSDDPPPPSGSPAPAPPQGGHGWAGPAGPSETLAFGGSGDAASGDTAIYPGGLAPMSGPTPPPPPDQALGMGVGWAPPPRPGPVTTGPVRRGPRLGAMVAFALLVALLASTIASIGTYLLTRPSSGTDPSFSLGTAPTGSVVRPPESVAGVASRVLPSVVSLEVEGGGQAGTGSGFIIKGGYIVTNNHVVEAAAQGGDIKVQFNNRKSSGARIVGRDPSSDIAVVKPDDTFGAPEITLGNSDNVVVGDPVIAIGSPLGLSGTVTTGIVSSLNRPVTAGESSASDTVLNAIQTDAAINPGNSGGPLVDKDGQVIGVNSAIATLSSTLGQGNIGLGFAIPVNHARRVAEELITTGAAKKSRIGVSLDNDYRGVGVRIASQATAGVQPVEPDGPADKAGLKPGDILLEVNGTVLQDNLELIALIRSKAPGEKVTVKYQRGGEERSTTVTVGTGTTTPAPQPS
jgi:putative serine protease PepD